ncbi:recombinase family protein [Burkholderia ubonensis]|uniref:recombinase family protein n=1 Tax=Burkholderia ubonensis TaxID=101571 RepID=UPI0005D80C14|nr:recombinase family protein [Burkholderia ubonensis]AJX13059.1 hypothetical protein BW23_3293 [Burkholderia ubonensis MSMB22]KVP15768.1 DNA resolvase [Burkholderia ubonensis]KVQ02974.1 DNA resolvase [Burkholderia ubonensis]KVR29961.1 DNA resolvase [Burkholderia ubonensis]KVX82522.1 DNA resolvase [Burkholderia ubonensis]
MLIGYARVSTDEQHLDLQLGSLRAFGCETVFQDHGGSGARFDRPGLAQALRAVNMGDTLVVWRLDRLGRSIQHLLELISHLQCKDVQFVSLTECIDTTSPTGRFIFHMLAALAEFERALIAERTRAGLAAARQRGSHLGRPRSLTPEQIEQARALAQISNIRAVSQHYNVDVRTLKRYLRLATAA